MGANCYKPKNQETFLCGGGRERRSDFTLSSLSDDQIKKHLTQNIELHETEKLELCGQAMNSREVAQIMSYALEPDDVLYALSSLSKASQNFLATNRTDVIEVIRESDQKVKLEEILTPIEEHEAGVNQIIHLNQNELATASHDFTIKVWDKKKLKCTETIQTETCNGFCTTGFRGKYLVTGYPNGDIFVYNSRKKNKLGAVSGAHSHLIRNMFSLSKLMHAYFGSIDVGGLIKVWQSLPQPKEGMEINLDSGIAYNSTIELTSLLPSDKNNALQDTAVIACALKSRKIHVILIDPIDGLHKIYQTLETSQKPSGMIELNGGMLGVGVGSLQCESQIEIWSYVYGVKVGVINAHNDMIDSMILIETAFESAIRGKAKIASSGVTEPIKPYFQSLILTSGRDKKFKIFKIYPGTKDDETYGIGEFDSNHTDYVRSLLQVDKDIFASASEDKSIRFYRMIE